MNTLILSGYGTNCEGETAHACRLAGAPEGTVHVRHITEIYAGTLNLDDYAFLVLIGGFLDGDDLGSARACVNRFRYRAMRDGGTFLDRLERFIASGRLVLGMCNGFQLMVKLGLLPGGADANGEGRQMTLGPNASGKFEDRWVRMVADPRSPCVFTRGIEEIELPVRHGEGRLLGATDDLLDVLVEAHQVPLRYADADGIATEKYPQNPNGSPLGAASLCDQTGRVMGLMPHPEAFHHATNHPRWTRRPFTSDEGDGVKLFRNAYGFLRS
jgi:phosphoribosylformylglycinamidine synthase